MSARQALADVAVVGEINPDIVVSDVPPLAFGQREDVTGPTTMTVGSSVAISACGLARLGTRTTIVGVVGDDAFGEFMLSRLQAREVDASAVRTIPGGRTGSSVILIRKDDPTDRQILTDAGVMGELRAADVTPDVLAGVRHLHVGSWFLHLGAIADLPDLLARARAAGLSTSVDPNDDPAQEWDSHLVRALPHVGTLFGNESEIAGVAGAAAWSKGGSRHGAARYLLEKMGPGAEVVLKCGQEGAFVHRPDQVLHVVAPTVDVVDTVGAGDSLAAGYLHARLRGDGLPESLALAVASGTLSTRRSGGIEGQATLHEAERLAEQLTCTSTPADQWRND